MTELVKSPVNYTRRAAIIKRLYAQKNSRRTLLIRQGKFVQGKIRLEAFNLLKDPSAYIRRNVYKGVLFGNTKDGNKYYKVLKK